MLIDSPELDAVAVGLDARQPTLSGDGFARDRAQSSSARRKAVPICGLAVSSSSPQDAAGQPRCDKSLTGSGMAAARQWGRQVAATGPLRAVVPAAKRLVRLSARR